MSKAGASRGLAVCQGKLVQIKHVRICCLTLTEHSTCCIQRIHFLPLAAYCSSLDQLAAHCVALDQFAQNASKGSKTGQKLCMRHINDYFGNVKKWRHFLLAQAGTDAIIGTHTHMLSWQWMCRNEVK